MSLPTDSMPATEGVSLTPRQATDVFVAIARFDERIQRLIETIRDDRKIRDRERAEDRAEVAELRGELLGLIARVASLETERIADKRSLGVWKVVGSALLSLLTAAIGAEWFGLLVKH